MKSLRIKKGWTVDRMIVAYLGILDNRSTVNTKTGYDEEWIIQF